jgi:hypothetical protein
LAGPPCDSRFRPLTARFKRASSLAKAIERALKVAALNET